MSHPPTPPATKGGVPASPPQAPSNTAHPSGQQRRPLLLLSNCPPARALLSTPLLMVWPRQRLLAPTLPFDPGPRPLCSVPSALAARRVPSAQGRSGARWASSGSGRPPSPPVREPGVLSTPPRAEPPPRSDAPHTLARMVMKSFSARSSAPARDL